MTFVLFSGSSFVERISKMAFTGWLLNEDDRVMLLEKFPPAYPDVLADHVTLSVGVKPLPEATYGIVVGIEDHNTGVQALVVEIAGTTVRPDGLTYHITWSIDRTLGIKPVDSNLILAFGFDRWYSIPIRLIPRGFE